MGTGAGTVETQQPIDLGLAPPNLGADLRLGQTLRVGPTYRAHQLSARRVDRSVAPLGYKGQRLHPHTIAFAIFRRRSRGPGLVLALGIGPGFACVAGGEVVADEVVGDEVVVDLVAVGVKDGFLVAPTVTAGDAVAVEVAVHHV